MPGGKYDNLSTHLVKQTKSVPTMDTISERDFAKLDRLLCGKPNATLSLEVLIFFSNNKTANWLHEKSSSVREALLQKAGARTNDFRKLYDAREIVLYERVKNH